MPFTFAHPAIVLPLSKLSQKYISMTGLIIGSMLPDFEYFIRMQLTSIHSHTTAGVFYFDLPLGLMLAFLFHNIVRDSLIDNLPEYLHKRFSIYKGFDWNKYFFANKLVVILSLLIGIVSHIVWDGFTHISGFAVEYFTVLSSNILIFDIPIYKVIQHGSTLVGMCFIIIFIRKMSEYEDYKHKANLRYWYLYILIILFGSSINLIDPPIYVGNFIVRSISIALLSLILASALWKYHIFKTQELK